MPSVAQFDQHLMMRKYINMFLVTGVIIIILGALSLLSTFVSTLATSVYFGWLLLLAGVMQLIAAVTSEKKEHASLNYFVGIIYLIGGVAMLAMPITAMTSLALFLSLFFLIDGLYKMAISAVDRFLHWGWVLGNGIVTFIMGFLLWLLGSMANFWVLGLFLAIELVVWGTSMIYLSHLHGTAR